MVKEYSIKIVEFSPDNQDDILEAYRLHKDQEHKIFDIACGVDNVMDYIEYQLTSSGSIVLLIKDKDKTCACFIMEDICDVNGIIIRCNVHYVVNKLCWGKESRDIGKFIINYLDDNIPVNRMEARVPQNNIPIIKLLKDLGFKHEGVLRNNLLFLDKNKQPKLYNELIYALVKE